MAEVAGRPIFAALHMLLQAERLFTLAEKQRLPAILADSRKYQNVVSTQLAEQVLAALYELLRGFQAADDQRKGQLLAEVLREDPEPRLRRLLTVLMRLVFLLYAEDRDLLSSDPVYANFYSVTGLFERLRTDDGRYPDTMDQRFGAWAQLLTLFRMIYEGGRHGDLRIPARKGYLFDPDRYHFLEGRPWKTPRRLDDKPEIPHVSDGVVFRVLQNLLILDGERLSYRTLDVEQIGSVYETMMGFNLEVAEGRSIAIKPTKSHGAPATINLEALLAAKPAERAKWLKEQTDQKLTGQAADALKKAASLEDLLAALEKKIAWHATPSIVPKGAMVLQPSDERRRSGSHYTPRSLTEPIVRTTLRPVLERLGPTADARPDPRPEGLRPGDGLRRVPGRSLPAAWRRIGQGVALHNQVPKLPPDEDELLYARRLIAQRCLYGVDRNPMAVDLAKLSLWLATLAKDHPFTFLDHACGPAIRLWGCRRSRSPRSTGQPKKQTGLLPQSDRGAAEAGDRVPARDPGGTGRCSLRTSAAAVGRGRRAALDSPGSSGDLVIAAYFSADKDKQREQKLDELACQVGRVPGPPMEDRATVQPLAAAVRRTSLRRSPGDAVPLGDRVPGGLQAGEPGV